MFQVDINFPAQIDADQELITLMCKSAQLPASNVGVIEVPFRGRTVKIAGDRTFDNWSATFINDKDMKARAYFEKWLNIINTHNANTAGVIDDRGLVVAHKNAGGYEIEPKKDSDGNYLFQKPGEPVGIQTQPQSTNGCVGSSA